MRIKSPIRFTIFLLVMCTLVYWGYTAAAKYLDLPARSFNFFDKVKENNRLYQNFIIAGVDEEETRTDLILFCQYNFTTNSVNILQIPRDTKVDTNRTDKKINSAYGSKGGTDTMLKEIGGLLNLKVDKYVIVSFKAFRKIIDELGGVEVDVPIRMYYTDPAQDLVIDLRPGKQTLNGKQSEMFMRFRKNNDGTGYLNGDVDRIKAQQTFYNSLSDKVLSGKTIIKAPKLLSIINDNIKTNFTTDEIVSYLGKIKNINKDSINIMALDGVGGYENSISYFFHDEEKTEAVIEQYFTPINLDFTKSKGISIAKNKFVKIDLVDSSGFKSENIDITELVKNQLEKYGFKVVNTVVSDKVSDKSRIIQHSKKNVGSEILKIYEGLPIIDEVSEDTKSDATIIIGSDFGF